MKCAIIANGNINNYKKCKRILNSTNYIICADGGAKHLRHMNVVPDVIIGDMDSIDDESRLFFQTKNVSTVKFPEKKDQSDSELATNLALSLNPSHVVYLGVTGSRIDHTLINIFLLKNFIEGSCQASIIDDNNEIYLIKDRITLIGRKGNNLSHLITEQ